MRQLRSASLRSARWSADHVHVGVGLEVTALERGFLSTIRASILEFVLEDVVSLVRVLEDGSARELAGFWQSAR